MEPLFMHRIPVPTVNDDPWDFQQLALLQQCTHRLPRGRVNFSLAQCEFLRPNAVAFLGGLARTLQARGFDVAFDWESCRDAVLANLCQNGFAATFGYPRARWTGNSIPFQEHLGDLRQGKVIDYLTNDWLGRVHPEVGEQAKTRIIDTMLEIYNNAFEHSESSAGVFSCGQYFPKLNELTLSVADFGVGIPHNVRHFFQKEPSSRVLMDLRASNCLRWAFKESHSTCSGVSRGLGLSTLEKFITDVGGRMSVYSERGAVHMLPKGKIHYRDYSNPIAGVILHLSIPSEEASYRNRLPLDRRSQGA